jgi:virginiamycin B lyase
VDLEADFPANGDKELDDERREAGAGRIGGVTPAGVLIEFTVPKIPAPAGSAPGTPSTTPSPGAITTGPDGALWFLGVPGDVGRITSADVVSEFTEPAAVP